MEIKNIIPPSHKSAPVGFVVYERLQRPLRKAHYSWSDRKIPPGEAKKIVYLLLRGVDYLHTNGIYHLDIKPNNLFIGTDCQPRIIDFGMAAAVKEGGVSPDRLRHGCAPLEHRRGFRKQVSRGAKLPAVAAAASDVWSLGVSIFIMLHGGGDPFFHWRKNLGKDYKKNTLRLISEMVGRPSDTVLKKWFAPHVGSDLGKTHTYSFTEVQKIFPKIPAELLRMVLAMLHPDPELRPSTRSLMANPVFQGIAVAGDLNLLPDPGIARVIEKKRMSQFMPSSRRQQIWRELARAYQVYQNGSRQEVEL